MLQTPELLPAILATTLVVIMTTFLFCCWKRKGSAKEESPEKSARPDVSNAAPQNGSVKENGEQSTPGDVMEFSVVQRESEILRPYSKPPPPKNRGKQTRAGRAMTRSTENLDVFGEVLESNEEESGLDTSTDSKVKIVLTDHSHQPPEGSDDKGGVTLREKTIKEDATTRDARSSMLADIEKTLATMHRESAKLADDSLTPVETSARGDPEPNRPEDKTEDGSDEAKKGKSKLEETCAETQDAEIVKTSAEMSNAEKPIDQNNLETKEDNEISEKMQAATNKDLESKQTEEIKLENGNSLTKDSVSIGSPQRTKIPPKVSPKPKRAAIAKSTASITLSEDVPNASDMGAKKSISQHQSAPSNADAVVSEAEQAPQSSKEGQHTAVDTDSVEDTTPKKKTDSQPESSSRKEMESQCEITPKKKADSALEAETTEKTTPPQGDGNASLASEQSAHNISTTDPDDKTKDNVDPSDQQKSAVSESDAQDIDPASPITHQETKLVLEKADPQVTSNEIDQKRNDSCKESSSEESNTTDARKDSAVTPETPPISPSLPSPNIDKTEADPTTDVPETPGQDSTTEALPESQEQMSEKKSVNPDSTPTEASSQNPQATPHSPITKQPDSSADDTPQSTNSDTSDQPFVSSDTTTQSSSSADAANQNTRSQPDDTPPPTSIDATTKPTSSDPTTHPAGPDTTPPSSSSESQSETSTSKAPSQPEARRDSGDGGAKGKGSKIPVKAGTKPGSSPPKSTSSDNDG